MRKLFLTMALSAAVLFAVAVGGPAAEPVNETKSIPAEALHLGRPIDFEKDVSPILEANCIACHNVGIPESKLNVETADAILKGGKRGPALVPKDPAASRLFQFASRLKQPAMPPLPNKVDARALTPKELGILKQWILEGGTGAVGGGGDKVQWQPIPAGMKSIQSVALSPWGRFVAAGRTNQVVVYDVVLGQEVARLVDPQLSGIQFEGRSMYPGGAADRDFIHSLAFSPDGSLLATGGYRNVKLWKRPQNAQKLNVALPAEPTALAVSPDGSLIAVATAEKTVELLSFAKGATARKLTGPSEPITGLQFSPDGKTLYAGSLEKSWCAWNVVDGAQRQVVAAPAPINALVLSKSGTELLTAGADGVIRIYSLSAVKSAVPVRELKGHTKAVTSLALALPAGTHVVSGSEDGSVRVWEIASGKPVTSINHGASVTAVAVRPDGQVIASAGVDKVARLWQASDGKRIAEMKGDLAAAHAVTTRTELQTIAVQQITAADARVKAVAQDLKERQESLKKAGEGKTAADKALTEAKAKEKAAVDALTAAKKELQAKPKDAVVKKKADEAEKAKTTAEQATKAAIDGIAAAVRAQEAAVKAVKNVELRLKETKDEKTATEAAKVSADKKLAESVAADAKDQSVIHGLSFSADGKLLATAGDDSVVRLWNAKTGQPLETFRGHAQAAARVAFLGNAVIASAAADKKCVVWDVKPSWQLVGRIGPKGDAPLDLSASPFVGRVLCIDFNSDGTLLATGGGEPSRSGELKIWNVPALTLVRELKDAHSDTVFGVEFSRDGKLLASCAADKFVKVFDAATGKHVKSFEGHTHHVLGVTWKADGTLLASASADNQIKVWNFESGEQTRSIAGYAKQVTSIQFIGTGNDVVSSGGDKTVRLHRTNDGANARTFEGATDFMYSAAASRDESIVVGGGEDGVLRVWNGADGKSLLTFEPPKPPKDSAQANANKQ